MTRGPAAGKTLAGRASRALGWSFGSTLLNKVSLLGIGIMLARLLGPHAFGTYAVAYVALVALLNFNELGVSLAIVRWPGDPREIIPTVTTISLLVSVIIFTACFFAAPAYATAMGAPAATAVVRVLAIAVLSDGLTNTPAALLQRNFRQGQRTIADQVNVWLGTAVTIALAWSGHGAMSLALGRVAGGAAGAILLLVFAPESLRLGFNPVKARALLQFGLPLAGANLIAFAVTSVDQVIVGHVLGPVELGFYVLALNLASWPIAMFSQPVRNVGPAVLARLQHDGAAMRTTFLSAAGLLCAVALPVCLGIGGAARPLIGFAYGTRWLPAARPLLCLALLAGVQVFFMLAYDLFVVLARSRFLLTTQLIWLLSLLPALAVGARADGLTGASLAELAVAMICVLPLYLAEFSRAGIRLRDLGRHLSLPFAGAALAGIAALAAAQLAPSDFMALAASGAAWVAVVGLLIYRMRTVLALLRASAAEPVAGDTAKAVTAAQTAGQEVPGHEVPGQDIPGQEVPGQEVPGQDIPPDGWLTAGDAAAGDAAAGVAAAGDAVAGHLEALATISGPPARRGEADGLSQAPAAPPPRPPCPDVTGPLAAYREFPGYPLPRPDLTAPLYWKTVAALRWDPASSTQRGHVPEPARTPAHRYRRKLTGAAAEVRHDILQEEQT